nr:MAG TPA: hypothetical protein [Caudoviricetes sp.]DAX31005.1 MAG TPA: hypothetical protein [Caudoviricetes sp.]
MFSIGKYTLNLRKSLMFLVIFLHCYRYSTNIIVMTSHTSPQKTIKIDTSYLYLT